MHGGGCSNEDLANFVQIKKQIDVLDAALREASVRHADAIKSFQAATEDFMRQFGATRIPTGMSISSTTPAGNLQKQELFLVAEPPKPSPVFGPNFTKLVQQLSVDDLQKVLNGIKEGVDTHQHLSYLGFYLMALEETRTRTNSKVQPVALVPVRSTKAIVAEVADFMGKNAALLESIRPTIISWYETNLNYEKECHVLNSQKSELKSMQKDVEKALVDSAKASASRDPTDTTFSPWNGTVRIDEIESETYNVSVRRVTRQKAPTQALYKDYATVSVQNSLQMLIPSVTAEMDVDFVQHPQSLFSLLLADATRTEIIDSFQKSVRGFRQLNTYDVYSVFSRPAREAGRKRTISSLEEDGQEGTDVKRQRGLDVSNEDDWPMVGSDQEDF